MTLGNWNGRAFLYYKSKFHSTIAQTTFSCSRTCQAESKYFTLNFGICVLWGKCSYILRCNRVTWGTYSI